jgi:hypothetical protein
VKGIEPSSQAWEAHILPLNHTRVCSCGGWNTLGCPVIQGMSFRDHSQGTGSTCFFGVRVGSIFSAELPIQPSWLRPPERFLSSLSVDVGLWFRLKSRPLFAGV